ncbi:MAG: hypothetical protein AAGG51_17025 [Cyanobacteria bacterium P01_G01_bin.54]
MARDEVYQKAERAITKALRTKATKLVVRYEALTELPESLGQLMQLQSLNLSGSQLTELPEWLGQLTQLQLLDLSGSQLNRAAGMAGPAYTVAVAESFG